MLEVVGDIPQGLPYPDGYVGPVTAYDAKVAAGIGALMPHLDERWPVVDDVAVPMGQGLLEFVVESPHHDELIAVEDGLVVGAASASLTAGPFEGINARLGDFVVRPDYQGGSENGDKRVAQRVWDTLIRWCQEKNATLLTFESELWRPTAHRFYQRNGAELDDDNAHFTVEIPRVAHD